MSFLKVGKKAPAATRRNYNHCKQILGKKRRKEVADFNMAERAKLSPQEILERLQLRLRSGIITGNATKEITKLRAKIKLNEEAR